ncbi:MAG: class A beta-lactamase-related serine hydrolase [Defluviitaleaceae bacterium]|nr:class A beta-lactamase-related serine hydrolase [Defluviitaleaceae bacterium]
MNRQEALKRFSSQNKNAQNISKPRRRGISPDAQMNAMQYHLPESRPQRKRPPRREIYLTDNEPEIPEAENMKDPAPPPTPPIKSKKSKLAMVSVIVLVLTLGGILVGLVILTQDFLDDLPVRAANDDIENIYSDEIYPYNPLEYVPEAYPDYNLPPLDRQKWWTAYGETPETDTLDTFFSTIGNNVSVFFMNLDTGFTYTHNPERVFFAASLSKSNHALYMFNLAERGYINMHEMHNYTAEDRWGGTGVLRFMDVDTPFTTRELLGFSIRESDNAAYRMLIRQTDGAEFSYRHFVSEIGANTRMVQNIISQNTNAYDAGLWMQAIFNYIESNSLYGHYFKYDLMNTSQVSHPYFERWEGSYGRGGEVNVSMIQADYPMARKYGWARNAFHDAAIVYAPSPYILVILSNMDRGAHDLFEEISLVMQDFNYQWFSAFFAQS